MRLIGLGRKMWTESAEAISRPLPVFAALLLAFSFLMGREGLAATETEQGQILCGWALAYEAWAGLPEEERSAQRHYGRSRVADILSVRLELEFDFPKERFWGTATTRLRAINNSLESVPFDAVDLDIKSARVDGGDDLKFDYDGLELIVRFPEALAEGQETSISIDYGGQQPRRGLHFVHPSPAYPSRTEQVWSQGEPENARYWFPCYDSPNEWAATEVIATVDKPKVALSNGKLVETKDLGDGRQRFHWVQSEPHVPYLVTLVAGEFDIIEEQAGRIPVLFYVPKEEKDKVMPTFGNTPAMIEFYAKKVGIDFPWDKYAQVVVEDFGAGGMENTSATTLSRRNLIDERNKIDNSADPVVAHELAHQWFGDLLTCRDWSHVWLNEGFATYFEALWAEESRGPEEFEMRVRRMMQSAAEADKKPDARPVVTNVYRNPGEMFSPLAYQKGACVLHMIRRELEDDLWWKALRHYAQKHRGGMVETTDFLRAIEEATGRNMEDFFEQWLYRPGVPQVSAAYAWNDKHGLAEITLTQTQTIDKDRPAFRLNLKAGFYDEQGNETLRPIEMQEATERFLIPLDEKPAFVEIDPRGDVLMELTFKKTAPVLLAQSRAAPTITGRLRAIEQLGELDDPKTAEALGETLKSGSFWSLRAAAATALGKNGGEAARAILLDASRQSGLDPRVRRAILEALGGGPGEEPRKALTEALWDEMATARVRAAAAAALAKAQRDKDEIEKDLIKALEIDSLGEQVCVAAIEGLERLGSAGSLGAIKEQAEVGRPVEARSAALKAMGSVAKKAKSESGIAEARNILLAALEDDALTIRRAAIQGLGNLGDEEAISSLEALAQKAVEWRLKSAAEKAVGQIRAGEPSEAEVTRLRKQADESAAARAKLEKRLKEMEMKLDSLAERVMQDKKPSEPPESRLARKSGANRGSGR